MTSTVDEANTTLGGWLPWFSENRLHILGWVQTRKNGPRYGVELELMTLLTPLKTLITRLNTNKRKKEEEKKVLMKKK